MGELPRQAAKQQAAKQEIKKQTAKAQAVKAASHAKSAVENGTGAIEASAGEAAETASKIDVKKISEGFGNVGQGFLALAVATYASTVAITKFHAVYTSKYTSS